MKSQVIPIPIWKLLLYIVVGIGGVCPLLYLYGYLDSVLLFLLGVLVLSSSCLAIFLVVFMAMGKSPIDDNFCIGKQKDIPLLAILLIVISLGAGIYGSIQLSEASISRALDIVNSHPMVHAEARVSRVNTREYRGNKSYNADIVYRHKDQHYYRNISCEKDEFEDGQVLHVSFPAEHPRMLVIDGVLR